MTTIAPNKSIILGKVRAVRGDLVDIHVAATRPAWPGVADLAAEHTGAVLTVRAPQNDLAPDQDVELSVTLGPGPDGLTPEFAV